MIGTGAVLVAAALLHPMVRYGFPPHYSKWYVLAAGTGILLLLNGLEARSSGWESQLAWWKGPSRNADILGHALIAGQLALLRVAFRRFHVENEAFWSTIATVAAAGFVLHALVPSRFRAGFFAFLSMATLFALVGWTDAWWVIGLGVGLIGLCHLPLPVPARLVLLLLAGAGLIWLRVGEHALPFSNAVWPVLGALFMFRIVVYCYDLSHGKLKPSIAGALSYFFMLPNPVFPLFPVVDSTTFRRTYYDAEPLLIYQQGVKWLVTGLIQILAYRFVYQYLSLTPSEVHSPLTLGQFLLANYLLYVRVSGQFHVIIGLLHLFGFHLPRTNNRYFLSAGFADLWRRINIYWKDFMLKVAFYPALFTLKRHGERLALVLGTAFVFVVTWALHSYQWLWLLGAFPVSPPEMLFWTLLGCLMVVSTLRETSSKRPAAKQEGFPAFARQVLRVSGVFGTMCMLWGLWMSPSIKDYLSLLHAGLPGPPIQVVGVILLGAVILIVAIALALLTDQTWTKVAVFPEKGPRAALAPSLAVLALLAATSPWVFQRLDPGTRTMAERIRVGELNQQDVTLLQRGYYEQLMGVSRINSQLWELYVNRPVVIPTIQKTPAGRARSDYLGIELVPSKQITQNGNLLTTNRWAMRDKDYEQQKPAGTFRIAIMGASTVMGWGVGDNETFENLFEQRLDQQWSAASGPYKHFESLNFSVPGYTPPQYLGTLDRALSFGPDAYFLVTQENDLRRTVTRVLDYARAGKPFPDDSIVALANAAVADSATENEGERRMRPYGELVMTRYYQAIADHCRAAGVRPVWIFLPGLEREPAPEAKAVLFRAAQAAHFTIIDLSSVYEGQDKAKLTILAGDYHPNVMGHRLIAKTLLQALETQPEACTPLPK